MKFLRKLRPSNPLGDFLIFSAGVIAYGTVEDMAAHNYLSAALGVAVILSCVVTIALKGEK